MLHVGCAVWAYDGWANSFFPSGTPKDERLKSYARRLTAVECNSTFYAVPGLPTIKHWAEQTPETFRFSPKFPKAITHTAQLKNVAAQTASFIGVMRVLGSRLGPLMLQLPPSFGPSRLPVLREYLESLPKDLQIAVEIRHPDWFTDDNGAKLNEVLIANHAARVVFDVRPAHSSESPDADKAKERKPDVPLVVEALQPFVVIRYISSPVIEENDPYLNEWVPRIAAWLKEDREVYFYAHCPVEDPSPFIARDLYQRVSTAIDLPPLAWDLIEKPPSYTDLTQLSLF
ncbi:MAG: DUF72 domain-containing protein [Chloroflexota bacterium]